MKFSIYLSILAFAAVCWVGSGCGHDHDHSEDHDHTEHSHDGHDHDGHDHADHDHNHDHDHSVDTVVTSNANSKTAHGDGSQYTAMYVCPMHCKGSGSNEPGKCPVCGMEYERFRKHVSDGHHHRSN